MSIEEKIQQLDNKLLSNYTTMLATCEAYINRGIDKYWWLNMKGRIQVEINKIKNGKS
jgi:hypothetical protein